MHPQAKSIKDNVTSILQREFEASKEYVPSAKDWLSSYWSGFMGPHQKARIRNTGEPPTGAASCPPPEDVRLHHGFIRLAQTGLRVETDCVLQLHRERAPGGAHVHRTRLVAAWRCTAECHLSLPGRVHRLPCMRAGRERGHATAVRPSTM